jgi:hypothetical protein
LKGVSRLPKGAADEGKIKAAPVFGRMWLVNKGIFVFLRDTPVRHDRQIANQFNPPLSDQARRGAHHDEA